MGLKPVSKRSEKKKKVQKPWGFWFFFFLEMAANCDEYWVREPRLSCSIHVMPLFLGKSPYLPER